MYYLLAPYLQPVGYKLLPFGVFDMKRVQTEFMTRENFELLYHCDGQHDIDPEALPDMQRQLLDHLVSTGRVTPCEKGAELLPHQQYRFYDNRYKDTVHWSITGRCNYRCKHCFMSAPEAKFGHPTKEQCLDLICQMEECGIRSVSLTGGEPLIRDDLPELVAALTEHHICITGILTNGALVNGKLLDMLEKNHQHPSFQLSYDGVGQHDWMRGVEGAEKKVLSAFELLKREGYITTSSMTLHRGNAGLIRDSVLTLRDVGCSALKINAASPAGEWTKHPEYFMTTAEVYETYLDYIPRYFADGAPLALMLEGVFSYEPGQDAYSIIAEKKSPMDFEHIPVCAPLRSMIYIGPEGIVMPCQSMIAAPIFDRYPNVFRESLRDILTDSVYIRDTCACVSDYMAHNPDCAACEYAKKCCGGCRAVGVGGTGNDFLLPDMRTCEFYKNGWYDRFKTLCDGEIEKFLSASEHPMKPIARIPHFSEC